MPGYCMRSRLTAMHVAALHACDRAWACMWLHACMWLQIKRQQQEQLRLIKENPLKMMELLKAVTGVSAPRRAAPRAALDPVHSSSCQQRSAHAHGQGHGVLLYSTCLQGTGRCARVAEAYSVWRLRPAARGWQLHGYLSWAPDADR